MLLPRSWIPVTKSSVLAPRSWVLALGSWLPSSQIQDARYQSWNPAFSLCFCRFLGLRTSAEELRDSKTPRTRSFRTTLSAHILIYPEPPITHHPWQPMAVAWEARAYARFIYLKRLPWAALRPAESPMPIQTISNFFKMQRHSVGRKNRDSTYDRSNACSQYSRGRLEWLT